MKKELKLNQRIAMNDGMVTRKLFDNYFNISIIFNYIR